jgi:Cu(I)/Ag(I) efflux system periplasmic protein CusF
MKYLLPITLAFALWTPAAAQQTERAAAHAHTHASATAPNASALAEGEVRRIDKERQRITIRHGVIPSLDMPPMTMVFQVQDRAMLDRVQVGQKVRFDADKKGSTYTVTHLEVAQ